MYIFPCNRNNINYDVRFLFLPNFLIKIKESKSWNRFISFITKVSFCFCYLSEISRLKPVGREGQM